MKTFERSTDDLLFACCLLDRRIPEQPKLQSNCISTCNEIASHCGSGYRSPKVIVLSSTKWRGWGWPPGVAMVALGLALGCGGTDGNESASGGAETGGTSSGSAGEASRVPAEPQCELTFSEGHGDVFVVFDEDLAWKVRSSFTRGASETLEDPSRVCVLVPPASLELARAMGGAPDSEQYAFLGLEQGAEFWLLPQAPRDGMPWFGVSTEGVRPSVFSDDQIELSIAKIEMPTGGNIAAWSTGTFGAPSLIFGTAAGKLVHTFVAGAHVHFNWAFTKAGTYRVLFEVAATRSGSREVSSSNLLRFLVQP